MKAVSAYILFIGRLNAEVSGELYFLIFILVHECQLNVFVCVCVCERENENQAKAATALKPEIKNEASFIS